MARVHELSRTDARRRLWPDEPDWHDAFIVLNANRPMPRKRIDLTIQGFAQFARDKPASQCGEMRTFGSVRPLSETRQTPPSLRTTTSGTM